MCSGGHQVFDWAYVHDWVPVAATGLLHVANDYAENALAAVYGRLGDGRTG